MFVSSKIPFELFECSCNELQLANEYIYTQTFRLTNFSLRTLDFRSSGSSVWMYTELTLLDLWIHDYYDVCHIDNKLRSFQISPHILGTSVVIFTLFIDALYMCALSASMAEWMGNPTLLLIIYTVSSVIGTLPIIFLFSFVLAVQLKETLNAFHNKIFFTCKLQNVLV